MNPKLQFVQDNPLPNLPEGPITTATLTEFYDATIKQSLPKYEDVVKMHKMIVAYVKDPRAVFWIRDFASRVKPINDVCLHPRYNCTLRRGWLIEYLDSSFAFCDNSFSTIFYALAWHSKVYELDELIKEMSSKVFPYGKGRYRATLETEKQCYTTPIEIAGGVGQKHSHIYDLKKEYSFAHTYADYSTNFQVFYTRGRRDDYIKHGNYFSWKINTEIDSVFKSRLIAQFVRLIHPLNHFLTPLKEFHTSDQQLFGNDIGEDPRMLLFMKKKVRELYPDIIDEFLELAMATEENENDIDGNIPITYGLAVQNQAQTARRNRTRTRPVCAGETDHPSPV